MVEKRITRRCEVSWHRDRQCGEPATHFAYPSSPVPPLAVCDEHAYQARRAEFRVVPIDEAQKEPDRG